MGIEWGGTRAHRDEAALGVIALGVGAVLAAVDEGGVDAHEGVWDVTGLRGNRERPVDHLQQNEVYLNALFAWPLLSGLLYWAPGLKKILALAIDKCDVRKSAKRVRTLSASCRHLRMPFNFSQSSTLASVYMNLLASTQGARSI